MTANEFDQPKFTFKIIACGEPKVGKTALVHRYTKGKYTSNYLNTLGCDFATKSLALGSLDVSLTIWDIAGQERFNIVPPPPCDVQGNVTKSYFRNADAAVVVFDVEEDDTFDAVVNWKKRVDDVCDNIPCVLLANKIDLIDETPDEGPMKAFCDQHGFVEWFPTSAKIDFNVTDAFAFIARQLLKKTNVDEAQIQELDLGAETRGGGCCS